MYDTFCMKEVDGMKTTAQIMRELREDHDLNQTPVAAVLGISQQHYSKYEKSDYQLPLQHLVRLADFYGVSTDYLCGRCQLGDTAALDNLYITSQYTGSQLLQDLLALDESGRQAVADYIGLQKLRQARGGH